jgi:glycerol kinase
MSSYILALDQGTSSSRSILFDQNVQPTATAQAEFTQYFPKSGWVEHEPEEIWESQWETAKQVLSDAAINASEIAAIGITNQRETTLIWERSSGKALHRAIVWQDRRTASICERLKKDGHAEIFLEKSGLVMDAYFSGTKLHWLLKQNPEWMARAQAGELCFGTVDSWLLYKLTGGKVHATDVSNASRTLLMNLETRQWDEELLKILEIPEAIMPQIKASNAHFGNCELLGNSIPIHGIAGDQQAALFGQQCWKSGMAKNTYGTGCFMLMNTGGQIVKNKSGILTTMAWELEGEEAQYALEGSVFVAGAGIQWLRDQLGMIESAEETEELAKSVSDHGGVYVVPAFAGLGAPYWDMYARGTIVGLSRGSQKEHIVRASLEAIAYQSRDLLEAMMIESGQDIQELRVDGGACANNFLMQFQADILDCPIVRPAYLESTAKGAAWLAGIGQGLYRKAYTEILNSNAGSDSNNQIFRPEMSAERRARLYKGWKKAVSRSQNWHEEDQI